MHNMEVERDPRMVKSTADASNLHFRYSSELSRTRCRHFETTTNHSVAIPIKL
jgi:hypothetical protein